MNPIKRETYLCELINRKENGLIKVITGISVMWFLVPGYLIAIILSFFVPDIYTAIAFDSGGVASGPMTATFMLPLALGACAALGGNLSTDAYGLVAMVALTPLITIQIMGVAYKAKLRRANKATSISDNNDVTIIEFDLDLEDI